MSQPSKGATPTQEASIEPAITAQDYQRLQERLDRQDQELRIFRQLHNPSDYNSASMKVNGDNRPRIRHRLWNEKTIVKWDNMKINKVRVVNGRQEAQQEVTIHFEDGTSETLDLQVYKDGLQFSEFYPVISVTTDQSGTTYTIDRGDKGLLSIHETFIN